MNCSIGLTFFASFTRACDKTSEITFAIQDVGGIRPSVVAALEFDPGIQLSFVASNRVDLYVIVKRDFATAHRRPGPAPTTISASGAAAQDHQLFRVLMFELVVQAHPRSLVRQIYCYVVK